MLLFRTIWSSTMGIFWYLLFGWESFYFFLKSTSCEVTRLVRNALIWVLKKSSYFLEWYDEIQSGLWLDKICFYFCCRKNCIQTLQKCDLNKKHNVKFILYIWVETYHVFHQSRIPYFIWIITCDYLFICLMGWTKKDNSDIIMSKFLIIKPKIKIYKYISNTLIMFQMYVN